MFSSVSRDLYLATALYDAIDDGDIKQVTILLNEKRVNPDVLIPEYGVAPLHLAAGYESEKFGKEATKLILRNGGNPNIKGEDGMTPLHIAAAWNHESIVRLLLSYDADPWMTDDNFKNAFYYAYQEGAWESLKSLEMYRTKNSGVEGEIPSNCKLNLDKVILYKNDIQAEYRAIYDQLRPSVTTQSVGIQTSFTTSSVNVCKDKKDIPVKDPNGVEGCLISKTDDFTYDDEYNWNQNVEDSILDENNRSKIMAHRKGTVYEYVPGPCSRDICDKDFLEAFGIKENVATSDINIHRQEIEELLGNKIGCEKSQAQVYNENDLETHGTDVSNCNEPSFTGDKTFDASELHESNLPVDGKLDETFESETRMSQEVVAQVATDEMAKKIETCETSLISEDESIQMKPREGKHWLISEDEDSEDFDKSSNSKTLRCKGVMGSDKIFETQAIPKNDTAQKSRPQYEDTQSFAVTCNSEDFYTSDKVELRKSSNFEASEESHLISEDESSENCQRSEKDRMPSDQVSEEFSTKSKNRKEVFLSDRDRGRTISLTSEGSLISEDGYSLMPDDSKLGIFDQKCSESENASDLSGSMARESQVKISRQETRIYETTSGDESNREKEQQYKKDEPLLPLTFGTFRPQNEEEVHRRNFLEEDEHKTSDISITQSGLCSSHESDSKRVICNEPVSSQVVTSDGSSVSQSVPEELGTTEVSDSSLGCTGTKKRRVRWSNKVMYSSPAGEVLRMSHEDASFDSGTRSSVTSVSTQTEPLVKEWRLGDRLKSSDSKRFDDAGSFILRDVDDVVEEYKYTDEEEGVVLIEKRLSAGKTPRSESDNVELSKERPVVEEGVGSTSDGTAYDTDGLRHELRYRGHEPGPITTTTKKFYLRKLRRMKRESSEPIRIKRMGPSFSSELERILEHSGDTWRLTLSKWSFLETEMTEYFINIRTPDTARNGAKESFTYLLLDPRVTRNLPRRYEAMEPSVAWNTFLQSVFYIGKGRSYRPYAHLYEAFGVWNRGHVHRGTTNIKVRHILDIWDAGLGVVCLHVFQNITPAEALTREAAMIDAVGISRLKNEKCGTYHGIAATWSKLKKERLGVYLLYRCMMVFIADGERQLKPRDIA